MDKTLGIVIQLITDFTDSADKQSFISEKFSKWRECCQQLIEAAKYLQILHFIESFWSF